MIRDLDLSSETEQFSFIRTVNVDARNHNNDNEELNKDSAVNHTDSRETSAQPEISTLCTTSKEKSATSLTINNYPTTISDRWYDLDIFKTSNLSNVVVRSDSPSNNDSKIKGFGDYLDRILLITAGGYVCLILWWLFARQNALFPIINFSQTEVISSADAEFIDYMKQSLEVIDRKVATKEVSQSAITASVKETPEVAYIPVYTPTPKNTFSSSLDLSQPNNLLPPPPPPNQLAAVNPPVSKTTAIPIESPAPPSESVKVKTIPATTTSSNSEPNETPEVSAATIQSKIDRSLVGVVQLEAGSAALFRINGVTQQILLGEKIENTNWILDSVANQKVKISDRDTTRILNVGEKF